jgi:bifunctional non-homologous end joining protein LigD
MAKPLETETVRAGQQTISITRPDKVLFPLDGITKRDMVDYYRKIAPFILPHLRRRPIAMQRFPDGIAGEGFFQKKAGAYFPDWVKTVSLAKQGGTVRYVICNDLATLLYLANQAVIALHTWLSRADQPENPDQLIFDLDPSVDDFRAVCNTAIALRSLLKERGLSAYVKTTGSRGLHVLVPLNRRKPFDEVRAFAQRLAQALVDSNPERLTTDVRKVNRRGRIFIDTGRNAYAQHAVAPYAVRPRDGAPVATPVTWEELEDPNLRPDRFNIHNIFDRLNQYGDLWKDSVRRGHALPRE